MIQNRVLRKISFKKLHDPTAQLFKDLKLLKLCDIVHLRNCLFMNQIEQNEKLAKSFSESKYCDYNHNYQTRSVTRKLLDIPYVKTDVYGQKSAKYHCTIDWNSFKRFLNYYWPSLEKHHKTTMTQKTSVSPSQTLLFFRTIIYYYYQK